VAAGWVVRGELFSLLEDVGGYDLADHILEDGWEVVLLDHLLFYIK